MNEQIDVNEDPRKPCDYNKFKVFKFSKNSCKFA